MGMSASTKAPPFHDQARVTPCMTSARPLIFTDVLPKAQLVTRMSEAIATLLQPHELRDHPEAEPLLKRAIAILEKVAGLDSPEIALKRIAM